MIELDVEGYSLCPGVFSSDEMSQLADELSPVERAGSRSLLDDERVVRVARDARLHALLGRGFFAVRALLFDKTDASNWGLRWHQDLSVAFQERREVAGFGSWTVKAGVTHALAPASVLDKMVSLRIHLDDCGPEVGPLRVVPASHRMGRLDEDSIGKCVKDECTCVARRGDVLAFKPLLLHASSSSMSPDHRRVLQLEFARGELSGGLKWRWQI
jgi:ectoine hydroxylase-related dioxygenase (phytanoyl-CoA dioxygenase family)